MHATNAFLSFFFFLFDIAMGQVERHMAHGTAKEKQLGIANALTVEISARSNEYTDGWVKVGLLKNQSQFS